MTRIAEKLNAYLTALETKNTDDLPLATTRQDKRFEKIIAEMISGGESGGVKSFTVTDTTKNIILETLPSIPQIVVWWDADSGVTGDEEISVKKLIFGFMGRRHVSSDKLMMWSVTCRKGSNTDPYSISTETNYTSTIDTFDENGATTSSAQVMMIQKPTSDSEEFCLSAKLVPLFSNGYSLFEGQKINYFIY